MRVGTPERGFERRCLSVSALTRSFRKLISFLIKNFEAEFWVVHHWHRINPFFLPPLCDAIESISHPKWIFFPSLGFIRNFPISHQPQKVLSSEILLSVYSLICSEIAVIRCDMLKLILLYFHIFTFLHCQRHGKHFLFTSLLLWKAVIFIVIGKKNFSLDVECFCVYFFRVLKNHRVKAFQERIF
jgi:hypothetical protein